MRPIAETPTPDLDQIFLRAGWPVVDSPKVRQLHADRMSKSRQAATKILARFFAAVANWIEQRGKRPA